MSRVRRGEFAPTVFEDESGRPKGLWAFSSRQEGWTRGHPAASVSAACDEFYGYQEAHAGAEALRKTALAGVERALRTARLQHAEMEAYLEGLDAAERLKIQGE